VQIYTPEWFEFSDTAEVSSRSGPPQPEGEMSLLIYFMAVLRSRPLADCPSTKRHSVKSDYCKDAEKRIVFNPDNGELNG
jgi:hypothetical protein